MSERPREFTFFAFVLTVAYAVLLSSLLTEGTVHRDACKGLYALAHTAHDTTAVLLATRCDRPKRESR